MAWRILISFIFAFAVTGSVAIGVPVEVGSGDNSAGLYVEWSDGYIAEFLVNFEELNVTGLELFDIVESETTLTTIRSDFGFGVFIDGIAYDGHSDAGYGGGENYWHYLTQDFAESSWTYSWVGVGDRILGGGDMDGWVYGHSGMPASGPTGELVAGLNIKMAIADEMEAEEAIDGASAKERAATEALNSLLDSGELDALRLADIKEAKRKIRLAMMRQSLAKRSLSKSVDKLEDALAILTGEGGHGGRPEGEENGAVERERADINGDGVIDGKDFAILSRHWLEEYEIEE